MNDELLTWCQSVLGPCEVVSGKMREDDRSAVIRLRLLAEPAESAGKPQFCYLKIHRQHSFWACEVHGYQHWAPVFGPFAPELLAVRNEEPLALVVSELPGQSMAETELSDAQALLAWQTAGQHLAKFHQSAKGDWFGPCLADGELGEGAVSDAQIYVAQQLDDWTQRGLIADILTPAELAVVHAARALIPAFADERPVPCHRDYCPVNWMVNGAGEHSGAWSGVIDFEFAHWDVRIADFTRYPNWEWMEKPHLIDAFFDGYGRKLTAREDEQCLVGHVQYALSAIVWGQEASFFGFQKEGQDALKFLAEKLK